MKPILILLTILFTFFSVAAADERVDPAVYADAIQKLEEKKFSEFSELIPILIKFRDESGYANLVPISERLLAAGKEPCASGDQNCNYYLKNAVILSPTDPWTLFVAGTHTKGLKDSASLIISALRKSTNSPTFFFKSLIASGIFLLTLFTAVVAIQLLFKVIRLDLNGVTPKKLIIFSLLLLLGLPFGIMTTALCWSVLAALFLKSKRSVVQLLLLTIGWVTFLPTAENMVKFVGRLEEREMELLLSKVASPSSGMESPKYLSEPLYLGTRFYREGNFEKAKEQLQRVVSQGIYDSGTGSAVIGVQRLAAAEIALRQYESARQNIANAKAQGLDSYELVHNEALIAASTGNLNESRMLLDKLRKIDDVRVSKESLSVAILLEPVPLKGFYYRYLEPQEVYSQVLPTETGWISDEDILKPLCAAGLNGLVVLSIIMTALLLTPTSKLGGLV